MKDYTLEMNLKPNWKLKDLPYKRPHFDEIQKRIDELCGKIKSAKSYEEVKNCIDENSRLISHVNYEMTLAYIRCYGDATDEFYGKELPEISAQSVMLQHTQFASALLESKFASDIDKDFGTRYLDIIRTNMKLHENGQDLMGKEQELIGEYPNIKASLRYKFDGIELSEAELREYFDSPKREVRKKALITLYEGWIDKCDIMFDLLRKLVKIRNEIASVNGYESYVNYANDEKGRSGYGEKELTAFCTQVKNDLVPFYGKIYDAQAKRLGIDHICSYDKNYLFKDENPKPAGNAEYLLKAAKEMYHNMAKKSGEIIDYMLEHELLDIMASKNKISGIGFCSELAKLKGSVIFANCNGTADDVTVLTHEIGHAFQGYMSFEKQLICDYLNGCNDIAEVPSKVMEQFAYPYAEQFFGEDADKFRYMHMQKCLIEIGAYCSVHEFETYLYTHPDASNEEWAEAYTKITEEYIPQIDLTDVRHLLEKGSSLFSSMGVYMFPRYLISYALCDICALEMKGKSLENPEEAWNSYVHLCEAGGSIKYEDLLNNCGLSIPYEEGSVKRATADIKKELLEIINKL